MINNRPGFKLLIIFQAVFFLALTVGESQAAKKKNKDDKRDQSYVMTEAELQAQVMAFADRYVALIGAASSIAAGPDPDFALLDMVVMITMGRLIFEEHYMKKYGNEFAPIVKRFRLTEKDIWQIAGRVLSKQQQKELMAMIRDWRRNHPEVITFSYIRSKKIEIFKTKKTLRIVRIRREGHPAGGRDAFAGRARVVPGNPNAANDRCICRCVGVS